MNISTAPAPAPAPATNITIIDLSKEDKNIPKIMRKNVQISLGITLSFLLILIILAGFQIIDKTYPLAPISLIGFTVGLISTITMLYS